MDPDGLDTETLFLLWVARETGVLAALTDDADTPEDVAARTGVTERSAELVVQQLLDRGFLAQVGEVYEPTNRLLGFLASADLRSVGGLPDALDALDALVSLPSTMRTGDPPALGPLVHRLGARWTVDEATVRAVATAAVRRAPNAASVLDVHGSPGRYATAFAELGRDVTLADSPDAIARSRPLLASTDVTATGVEPNDDLPSGFDLVFAGDVAHRRPPADDREFAGRLAAAAAPDGTVVVADRFQRDGEPVPGAVTAFARTGGAVSEATDYRDCFADAGLVRTDVESVPGTDRSIVVGRRDA